VDIAGRHGVRIATVAHGGDGNLHLTAAIALCGTVTGEHGIGLLKRRGMRQEMTPAVLAMQRAVKQAFDPLHPFNPGKVVGDPDR
jgi:glycolate oxidase